MSILLDGHSLTLDDLVAIARSRRAGRARATCARDRVRAARAVVDDARRARHAGLRHQHRLRQLRRVADPARLARRAAAESAAQSRRRRRRAAAGAGRPRDDGAARQRAGERVLRHSRRDARRCCWRCSIAACIRVVPSRGSVGASGDLAPLAHLALVLIGEGEALARTARASRARDGAGARGSDAGRARRRKKDSR